MVWPRSNCATRLSPREGCRQAARSAVPTRSRPLTPNVTPLTLTKTARGSGRSCEERLWRCEGSLSPWLVLYSLSAGAKSASAAPIDVDAKSERAEVVEIPSRR